MEPKGISAHQSTDRTQSRVAVTQAGVGYGGRCGRPSLPEVGAVCLNGHARICAGGAGQPASLPRLLAACSPVLLCDSAAEECTVGTPSPPAPPSAPRKPPLVCLNRAVRVAHERPGRRWLDRAAADRYEPFGSEVGHRLSRCPEWIQGHQGPNDKHRRQER